MVTEPNPSAVLSVPSGPTNVRAHSVFGVVCTITFAVCPGGAPFTKPNCTLGGGDGGGMFDDGFGLGVGAGVSVGSGWVSDGAGDSLSCPLLSSSDAGLSDVDSSSGTGSDATGELLVIGSWAMVGVGVPAVVGLARFPLQLAAVNARTVIKTAPRIARTRRPGNGTESGSPAMNGDFVTRDHNRSGVDSPSLESVASSRSSFR